MPDTASYSFPPFRLDVENGVLWRETTIVPLRPKTFAVLHHLLAHAGHVVTRDDLRETIWGKTKVSAQVLRASVWELRHALDDNAAQPRFIETVPGGGWRFIAAVVRRQPSAASREEENQKAKGEQSSPAPCPQHPPPLLVGRDAELARLHGWLDKALSGERQIIFVTGEPGIGKTALVEAFLTGIEEQGTGHGEQRHAPLPHPIPVPRTLIPRLWLTRGQCIEHFGVGEAYMPVLDALERLARTPGHEHLLPFLRRYAPLWLVQMPSLVEPQEQAELQRQLAGTTRERMQRELAVLLEVLTVEQPLVLVLEDLHWSDVSTVELLAMLARRQEPARLLVIGTFRTGELLQAPQPVSGIMRELRVHGLSTELTLVELGAEDVAIYLTRRFLRSVFPTRLAELLHQRTEGNPLFLISIIQDLITRERLREEAGYWLLDGKIEELEQGIPESLRQVVARRREQLQPDEREVLEAASLVGQEFAAATLAAVLDRPPIEVETQCSQLAERHQFLQSAGISEWPDGTVSARYRFHHALYQQLWHERVPVGRRQVWHGKIGERLERAYGTQAGGIASELAVYFEEGRDYPRAIQYHEQAATTAVQRHTPQEALLHFSTANALLAKLPETPERARHELNLHLAIGGLLMTIKGYAAPEVEQTYYRARQLCTTVAVSPSDLFHSLWGVFAFHLIRAELDTAHAIGEQICMLAAEIPDFMVSSAAQIALGVIEHHRGNFVQAYTHLTRGVALLSSLSIDVPRFGQEPGITGLCYQGFALAPLGYLDRAQQHIQQALCRAQALADPFSLAFCHEFACFVARWRGESHRVAVHSENLLTLAMGHEFRYRIAIGHICHGWTGAEQSQIPEAIAEIRTGLAICQEIGAVLIQPFFLSFLVEVAGRGLMFKEGIAAVTEALEQVQHTGERFYEAELYRLKGELTLGEANQRAKDKRQKAKISDPCPLISNPHSEAEACFLKAIDIAQKQHAKSWELRATLSLARLWRQQGKAREAHQMLSAVYNWFTEGFDTKDLQEVKLLLEELA